MKLFSLAGVAIFMLTSMLVGTRLLLLWRRTRRLPELLLATALWCTGFFGFALGMVAKILAKPTGALRHWLPVIGLCSEYVGCTALLVFAWRVFHPRDGWARLLCAALGASLALAFFGELASGEYRRYADLLPITGAFVPLGLVARALPALWLTTECFRYHAMLRRRLRLGLAEPLVVHRVALWGAAIASTFCAYVVSFVHRCAYGTGLQAHVWALDIVAALAVVSAVGIGFAFFPPSVYRRWVDRAQR